MKTHFVKKYASTAAIISNLKSKGIEIENSHAENLFTFKNYYRFIPYIKISTCNPIAKDEKSLKYLEKKYLFDKKLRNIISESTESIENFARNDITEYFGKLGINFYKDFLNPDGEDINNFESGTLIFKLNKVLTKSDFEGIIHHRKKYIISLDTVPIWVLVETLEFGTTIWFLDTIKKKEEQNGSRDFYNLINKKYDIDTNEYMSCMKSSKSLRNLCAHGNRLYQNNLNGDKPRFPSSWNIKNSSSEVLHSDNTEGLYRKLFGLKAFYKYRQDAWNDFINLIELHFESNKDIVCIQDYGIESDWIQILKKW